jgi:hypothetical protein
VKLNFRAKYTMKSITFEIPITNKKTSRSEYQGISREDIRKTGYQIKSFTCSDNLIS